MCLSRSHARAARAGRVHRFALVPHRHLQGALRRRPARSLLPRPARSGARGAVRNLPSALFDQHGTVLGARATTPSALPQRRDQLDRRKRRLDAGTGARPRGGRLGLDAVGQRTRAAGPRRQRHSPLGGDADPGGGRRGSRARRAGPKLLPLPLDSARTVGRPCRCRLHRRARGRRDPRPQRPAPTPLRRRRRPSRRLRFGGGSPLSSRRGRDQARPARPGPDARRRSGRRNRGEPGREAEARPEAAVHPVASRHRAAARSRCAGEPADGELDRAPGRGRLHPRGSIPPSPPVGGHRPRADLLDGRRHRAAAARRTRAPRDVVSPSTLRAGHEPPDRPPS